MKSLKSDLNKDKEFFPYYTSEREWVLYYEIPHFTLFQELDRVIFVISEDSDYGSKPHGFDEYFDFFCYPNGDCKENEGYISLMFRAHSKLHYAASYALKVTLTLVDVVGCSRFFRSFEVQHDSKKGENEVSFGFGKYLKRNTLMTSDILVEDKLVVRCEMYYYPLKFNKSTFLTVDEECDANDLNQSMFLTINCDTNYFNNPVIYGSNEELNKSVFLTIDGDTLKLNKSVFPAYEISESVFLAFDGDPHRLIKPLYPPKAGKYESLSRSTNSDGKVNNSEVFSDTIIEDGELNTYACSTTGSGDTKLEKSQLSSTDTLSEALNKCVLSTNVSNAAELDKNVFSTTNSDEKQQQDKASVVSPDSGVKKILGQGDSREIFYNEQQNLVITWYHTEVPYGKRKVRYSWRYAIYKTTDETDSESLYSLMVDETNYALWAIMGEKSPYFKTLFSILNKDGLTNLSPLSFQDHNTLNTGIISMLHNAVENTYEICDLLELYEFADKFLLPDIKQNCSDLIKTLVTSDTVCYIVALADIHSDADLKEYTTQYAIENWKDVVTSDGWIDLQEQRGDLVELFRDCHGYDNKASPGNLCGTEEIIHAPSDEHVLKFEFYQ